FDPPRRCSLGLVYDETSLQASRLVAVPPRSFGGTGRKLAARGRRPLEQGRELERLLTPSAVVRPAGVHRLVEPLPGPAIRTRDVGAVLAIERERVGDVRHGGESAGEHVDPLVMMHRRVA